MIALSVAAAAGVICRAMENGEQAPAGWAAALDAAGMLMTPEAVAEQTALRNSLERRTSLLREVQAMARRLRKEADGRKAYGDRLKAENTTLRARVAELETANAGLDDLRIRAIDKNVELRDRIAQLQGGPRVRGVDEDPIAFTLTEQDGGLTAKELAQTPDGTYRCKCGHWDNVHGPFCFSAACGCGKFRHDDVRPQVRKLRNLLAGQRAEASERP